MSALLGETLLTLTEVARRLPSPRGNGKRMHYTAILRRIVRGTRNVFTGRVVKLEAIRDGGRYLTSEEALARYHAALSPPPAARPMTPKQRAKRTARVNAACDAAGI